MYRPILIPMLAFVFFPIARPVGAQEVVELWARADCDGGSIEFTVTIGGRSLLNPEVAGFDIFARETGDCARGAERLNADVIPIGETDVFSFSLVHSTAFEGKLFRYEVLPVNGAREPMDIEDIGSPWQYLFNVDLATCSSGAPVFGEGLLRGAWPDFAWMDPCPDTCWGIEGWVGDRFNAPMCEPFVESGVPVKIYFLDYRPNGIEGASYSVAACEPASCSVPAKPGSFGSIKGRFE